MALILYKWLFVFAALMHTDGDIRAGAHPFYLSVTEIHHNEKEESLEISVKIFADDLEATLRSFSGSAVDLSVQNAGNDRVIESYITGRLSLTVNGKSVPMQFIGFEHDRESVYSYFQVQGVEKPRLVEINNSLLHDYKKEQVNIMHITVNGKRKSSRLVVPATRAEFRFD